MSALTMSRPLVAPRGYGSTITAADDDCDTCFGTGEIYAKPGVYKPCPACCGGFTAVAPVESSRILVPTAGCAAYACPDCGHLPGCGCDCCPYQMPAVAVEASIGGAR